MTEDELDIYTDLLFVDQRIEVFGKKFVNCDFHGCVVYCGEGDPVAIGECKFLDCQFDGSGWPDWFLLAVHASTEGEVTITQPEE